MSFGFTDRPLIALDADGVLVDYHEGYARAWELAFGVRPKVKDPLGYHPRHYWDVPELDHAERKHLNEKGFGAELWASLPAMPGAVEACHLLEAMGHRLVCVTALHPSMQAARGANLLGLGMPIDAVYATGHPGLGNPKAARIRGLKPVAFVDDFLPYLQGAPASTWCALVRGRPNQSPNVDPKLEPPHSQHDSLLDFAKAWPALAKPR